MKKTATKGAMKLVAHRGDAKTLLAFDLTTTASRQKLAGFTVRITPPGKPAYFMFNSLRFEHPENHAQDASEPATSTINAPIHKFRWIHVPGSFHQGLDPVWGDYLYEVTPRYFDGAKHLHPLDANLTAKVKIEVAPFRMGKLAIGFTRGFTQSQAFTNNFGKNAKIRPSGGDILFDTSKICGTNAKGVQHTFEEQYIWSGFTARALINECLDEVINGGTSYSVDIFAYDLNEPGVVERLVKLGTAGKARIVLDNAALHHNSDNSKPEDKVGQMFVAAAGPGKLKRGKFGRYAHDKIFIVKKAGKPIKVLTGSTNFSVTGLYVNSNHVLLFDDEGIAKCFADIFESVWTNNVDAEAFRISPLSQQSFSFLGAQLPKKTTIDFSPHRASEAKAVLGRITDRVDDERANPGGLGNVLFAVMELGLSAADNPVYEALNALHEDESVFSFGISDNPEGIQLYKIGAKKGVLVTGKPTNTKLPPPFNQVRGVGLGHQIHHKFVVCDINGANPTVFCGSSNLALGGEKANGDNLLMIEDEDVTMVFAIEALGLIDHFNFLDRVSAATPAAAPPAMLADAAVAAEWFLGTSDAWAKKFFNDDDLHSKDRQIFAS